MHRWTRVGRADRLCGGDSPAIAAHTEQRGRDGLNHRRRGHLCRCSIVDGERRHSRRRARRNHEVELRFRHIQQRRRRQARDARRIRHRHLECAHGERRWHAIGRARNQIRSIHRRDRFRRHSPVWSGGRLHLNRRNHAIVTSHPVRQDVIDAGACNQTASASTQLKRALLPHILIGRAQHHRNRDCKPPAKPAKPEPLFADSRSCRGSGVAQRAIQQRHSFRIARRIRTIQAAVDDVEHRVLMTCRVSTKLRVCQLINGFGRTRFQANQVVEGNVVQIELEIRVVLLATSTVHRHDNARGQQDAVNIVIRGEFTRIQVPADLQQRQHLIWPNQKCRADASIRHHHGPIVPGQESNQQPRNLAYAGLRTPASSTMSYATPRPKITPKY